MNKPSPKAVFIGINEKDDMKITTIVAAIKPHIRNVDFGGIVYTFLFSLL
jgi:hypothetical protein